MNTNEFTLFVKVGTVVGQFEIEIESFLSKLTKREELSLRVVLALPKASSTGLVCTT